jgi:hypothetical protein
MKKAAAVEHFGSVRALAEVLGVTVQAVYDWGDDVPLGRDFQIEVLTRGALKAREGDASQQAAA